MDALRNLPELIVEFVTRRDYIALYLGLVGLWCAWLAVRGLRLGSTQAFGFRAPEALGERAVATGKVWLAIAVALIGTGTGLWLTG